MTGRRTAHPVGHDYSAPRSNTIWPDHVQRVAVTVGVVQAIPEYIESVIDPACGDGSIVDGYLGPFNQSSTYTVLGDLSQANMDRLRVSTYEWKPAPILHVGDVLDTLSLDDDYDLCILTEILEHVEDPSSLLHAASSCSRWLVASSPVIDQGKQDGNVEHLWMFDEREYEELLRSTGWEPFNKVILSFFNSGYPYRFQIWTARNDTE